MKKVINVLLACFIFGFFAALNAQVLSGSFHFDGSTPEYTLNKNEGNRIVDIEVRFNKAFESTPKIFLSITKIDTKNDSQMRYAIGARSITKEGFTIRATAWADTQISAIGGNWIAHIEE
jgi:hypothetical protein